MSPLIPYPPDLKPTIIQMQNVESNEAISDQSASPSMNPSNDSNGTAIKKRRRRSSSSLISQSEIDKRRREHKTAHSIIEKKRRIRMNREFEALKYLVPACRNNLTASNNNGEGMYKLTILQATVDYIKYLHDVINIQHDALKVANPQEWDVSNDEADQDNNNDGNGNDQSLLGFAKFDIDTDLYRNVDNEFDFNKLFDDFNNTKTPTTARSSTSATADKRRASKTSNGSIINGTSSERKRHDSIDLSKFQSLPSPIITPELYQVRATSSSNPTSYSSSTITTTNALGTIKSPINDNNYQTVTLKPDFQFPKQPALLTTSNSRPKLRSFSDPLETSPSIPSSTSSVGISKTLIEPQITSKLDIIREIGSLSDNNLHHEEAEAFSAHALLSMKKDGSITSIKSLLN